MQFIKDKKTVYNTDNNGYVCVFSSDKYPEVQLLGHMAVLFLNFEKPPYCLPQGCANLQVNQYCTKLPFSPHPQQHLLFVVFWMITTLIGVR